MAADATGAEPLLAQDRREAAEKALTLAHVKAGEDDVAALRTMPREDLFVQRLGGVLPLHWAAAHNALAAMAYLQGIPGANIDAFDGQGRTPLLHAVAARQYEAVVWLIRHGANAALQDSDGQTAAHWAAQTGATSLLALLANLGVPVDGAASASSVPTPLEVAATSNRLEVVEYLMLTRSDCVTARAAALEAARASGSSFWICRCLEAEVGCHELAPGDNRLCGAVTGACTIPLSTHFRHEQEQTHIGARALSVVTGCLAVVAAVLLMLLPKHQATPTWRYVLSFCSLVFTLLGFVTYFRAACGSPGRVDTSADARERYEAALGRVAAVGAEDEHAANRWGETAPIIHQLAIVGPPRSKYCSARRHCVPVFDHYCGFLRNSVGQDNYRWFLSTVVLSELSCICLVVASVLSEVQLSHSREVDTYAFVLPICIIIYFGIFIALWMALIAFHVFLAYQGLTTNEMLKLRKEETAPAYLLDPSTGAYKNPYDHGCFRNFFGRVRPTSRDVGVAMGWDNAEKV